MREATPRPQADVDSTTDEAASAASLPAIPLLLETYEVRLWLVHRHSEVTTVEPKLLEEEFLDVPCTVDGP